jgi:hypothetical protein
MQTRCILAEPQTCPKKQDHFIRAWHVMAFRKIWPKPRHTVFVQPVKIAHHAPTVWELWIVQV